MLHETLKAAGKLQKSGATERTNGSQRLAIIADYPRHHRSVASMARDCGLLACVAVSYRPSLPRVGGWFEVI